MIGIILLICGLLLSLFGYKIYRLLLFIIGLIVGVLLGIVLAAATDSEIMIVGGLVLGVLLGVINVLLMRLGIFLMCFFHGFFTVIAPMLKFNSLLKMGINYLFTGNMDIDNERVILGLVIGLILGVIGVIFCRAFIILFTALYGGIAGGIGFGILSHSLGTSVIVGLVIAALGIIAQILTTKKKQKTAVSQPMQTVIPVRADHAESGETKYTELKEAMKQSGGQAAEAVMENVRKAAAFIRQAGENSIAAMKENRRISVEKVLTNERDFSGTEILEKAERILYDTIVLSWVMPFLEAITIAWAILSALIGILYYGRAEAQYFQAQRSAVGWAVYGAFAGLHAGMPVQLLSCLLGTVKRNHRLVLGILCGGAITSLVTVLMGNGSVDISATVWYSIPEIALYVSISIFYYIKLMKRQ